jgi:hypothetical protein
LRIPSTENREAFESERAEKKEGTATFANTIHTRYIQMGAHELREEPIRFASRQCAPSLSTRSSFIPLPHSFRSFPLPL